MAKNQEKQVVAQSADLPETVVVDDVEVAAEVAVETFAPVKEIAEKPPVDTGVKVYKTTRPVTHPFDILCRGVNILGHWNSMKKEYVRFVVPEELVESFELHDHIVTGFVAAE